MSSNEPLNDLTESGITMHSDSELYSGAEELSSPPSSNSPVILYKPPTVWSLIRGAAINLLLPFINGMMLGFGELFAHEAAFRLGWGGTKVSFGYAVESIKALPSWNCASFRHVRQENISLTHPRSSRSLDGELTLLVPESSFANAPTLLDLHWTTLQAWSKLLALGLSGGIQPKSSTWRILGGPWEFE